MNTLSRVAVTCATALLIGEVSYLGALDIDGTGLLGSLLRSDALSWAFYALPVLIVALVNRWWALSIALVPLSVQYFLHTATDYVYPYHEDPYPALAVMGTLFLLVISSLGFVLRAVFDLAASKVSRLRDKHR
ncbi:MAG TPA: hypothetical protein VGB06_00765 [Solirubrobacterales bacterium]|jgi:hypothetical protein